MSFYGLPVGTVFRHDNGNNIVKTNKGHVRPDCTDSESKGGSIPWSTRIERMWKPVGFMPEEFFR